MRLAVCRRHNTTGVSVSCFNLQVGHPITYFQKDDIMQTGMIGMKTTGTLVGQSPAFIPVFTREQKAQVIAGHKNNRRPEFAISDHMQGQHTKSPTDHMQGHHTKSPTEDVPETRKGSRGSGTMPMSACPVLLPSHPSLHLLHERQPKNTLRLMLKECYS